VAGSTGRASLTTAAHPWRRRRRVAATVAAAVGLGVVLAGCGGGSHAPSVASLGPTTSTAPTSPSSGGGGSSGRPGVASFVAFADCMDKHGIPVTVSASQGNVGFHMTGGGQGGSLKGSSQFQAAQEACQKLLPGGGPKALTPAQEAQARRSTLALAACMRRHGYPNFPDPTSAGVLDLTGIDPNSTQFQTAMQTCSPHGAGPIAIRASRSGPGPGPG
jgi:hypothetical protein